jgi:hypothetical protein
MEENKTEAVKSGLRWGRAFVAALIAEVLLVAIARAMGRLLPGEAGATIRETALLLGTALLFTMAGYWTAKSAHRAHIANGIAVGVIGTALYILLRACLSLSGVAPFDGTFSLPNLFDHALKMIAGAAGGYLAMRKAATLSSEATKL